MDEISSATKPALMEMAGHLLRSEHVTARGWAILVFDQVRDIENLLRRPKHCDWQSSRRSVPRITWRRVPEDRLRGLLRMQFHRALYIRHLLAQVEQVAEDARAPEELALVSLASDYQYSLPLLPPVGHGGSIERGAKNLPYAGQTKFRPSLDLATMWVAGVRAHIEASNNREKIARLIDENVYADARNAFSIKFKRMIASIGNRLCHGEEKDPIIASGGYFSVRFQHETLDRFHIVPDRGTAFFYMMLFELVSYLEGGGVLQGSWGEMQHRQGTVMLKVTTRTENREPWDIAQIIE